MKKLTVLILFFVTVFRLFADVFDSPHRMYQLETEHFTIIFPEESRAAAERLYGMAEVVYADIALRLSLPLNLHIPVVITPDTDQLNGYFTYAPSSRIMLYEAPILPNSGFVLYDDVQKKLFLHELTHAVSMTNTNDFIRFFRLLMGDRVSPAAYLAPDAFIEGVTVSFESADGFGRANDTPYASIIQQDILENRFMTFAETSDIRDRYPGGSWYIYGGWFSRYLQETYGMDAYARLWKSFGSGKPMQDVFFARGAFHSAFGVDLETAWTGFRIWMQIKRPVVSDLHPLSDSLFRFNAMTAHGSMVYFSVIGGIYSRDSETGTIQKISDLIGQVNRLDVSPDGKRLLISYYQSGLKGLATAVVRELDLSTGSFTSAEFPAGLVEAGYAPDGIVAVRVRGYTTDLVHITASGERLLLSGTESRVPSIPCFQDDGSIVFILQIEGVNHLARTDGGGVRFELLTPRDEVRGIRNLFSDGRRISFIYDNDFTLFKLGTLEDGKLALQTVPLSGGIQFPVFAGDDIVYAGYFSHGHKLMGYPSANPDLTLSEIPSEWSVIPEDVLDQESAFARAAGIPSRDYNPLPWLLIPQTRFPALKINSMMPFESMIQGAGMNGQSSDPSEGFSLDWTAQYLWNYGYVDWSVNLTETVLPVPITLFAYDLLSFGYMTAQSTITPDQRILGVGLAIHDGISLYPFPLGVGYSLQSGYYSLSTGPSQTSPYEFTPGASFVPLSARVMVSSRTIDPLADYQSLGWSIGTGYDAWVDPLAPALPYGYARAEVSGSLPFLNFSTRVSGLLSLHSDLGLGLAGAVIPGNQAWFYDSDYPAFPDYAYLGLTGPVYLFSDSSVGHEFKTQTPFLLGTYVQSFDVRLGYRSSYVSDTYLDIVYGIIAAEVYSDLFAYYQSVPFVLGLEVHLALQADPYSAVRFGPFIQVGAPLY